MLALPAARGVWHLQSRPCADLTGRSAWRGQGGPCRLSDLPSGDQCRGAPLGLAWSEHLSFRPGPADFDFRWSPPGAVLRRGDCDHLRQQSAECIHGDSGGQPDVAEDRSGIGNVRVQLPGLPGLGGDPPVGPPWQRADRRRWPVKVPVTYPKRDLQEPWFALPWTLPRKGSMVVKTEVSYRSVLTLMWLPVDCIGKAPTKQTHGWLRWLQMVEYKW